MTILHKLVAERMQELRKDSIWIDGEDVTSAFKPMKMGLLVAHLVEDWEEFVAKYNRVRKTFQALFNMDHKLNEEEIAKDLENLRLLREELIMNKYVHDTAILLN